MGTAVLLGTVGAAAAVNASRMVVMAPTREGGQAQFIGDPQPPSGNGSLTRTLAWIKEHAAEPLTVADIARRLFLSEGTVRNYLSSAIGKTGARTRVEAARVAADKGWL